MNFIQPADIVRNIRDLPSLPLIVSDLISSLEQKDVSVGALADKVSQDQALVAKTLRLANSSFYGLQCKVKTIQQAMTVLGFDSVRALIIATGVIEKFRDGGKAGFDFKAFWRHSIGTALCAKSIARMTGLNQDYGFIAGLLHDIGTLVLVTRFSEQYERAAAYRTEHDSYMFDAEKIILGTDHAAVGRALAEHWKFPPLIQRAIANHHAPVQQDLGDTSSLVHVADVIVHALDLGGQENDLVPSISAGAWDSLRINPQDIRRIFYETETEFKEACQIMAA